MERNKCFRPDWQRRQLPAKCGHAPTPRRLPITSRRTPFAAAAVETCAQEVGSDVGDKLDSTPRPLAAVARARESARPIHTSATSFLDADECRQLREKIDAGSYPSPLYDKDKYEDVRTSYSCNLDVPRPLIVGDRNPYRQPARHRHARGRAAPGPTLRSRPALQGARRLLLRRSALLGANMSRMAASAPGPR